MKPRIVRPVLVGAAVLCRVACGGGVDAKHDASPPNHASLRLLSEPGAFVPGAETLIGIAFSLDPGWHVYWNGQNDTGYPIRIEAELPDGYAIGDLSWPPPERHVSPGGILDHVYHERVTLLLPVRVPEDAHPGGRARLRVRASWMICRGECIRGRY